MMSADSGRKCNIDYKKVALYALFLLLVVISPALSIFITLYLIKTNRGNKLIYAALIGLTAASFAYGVHTTVVADIDRYTNALPIFRQTPLNELLSINNVYSSVGAHGYNLMAWVISRLGNDHLLRSVVVFSFYCTSSYIIFDYGCDEGWSNRKTLAVITFAFCAIPFFNILSYAKSTPAFSIALLTIYLDIQKKINPVTAVCLYILAVSFHTSTIPIILLRYLYLIFGKNWKWCFSAVLLMFPIASILAQIVPSEWGTVPGLSLVVTALEKFKVYKDFSGWGWAAESQNSILSMGYRYYYIGIACLYIFATIIEERKKQADKVAQYGSIYAAWSIAVSIFFAADIFFRYTMPMTVLSSLEAFKIKLQHSKYINIILFIIAGIGLVVQLAYLCRVADISRFVIHATIGLI